MLHSTYLGGGEYCHSPKKALLISHIHTPHTTTPPKMSHPAAWRQPGSRGQLCGGGQLGGPGSSAAAWRQRLQLGCGGQLGGVGGSTAALWRQRQLGGGGKLGGGSGSLGQHGRGGGSGSAAAAAVAA